MTFLANYTTDRIRTDYILHTRGKLFDVTLDANWTYLSKQKIGHLEKVLMNDINAYSSMLSYVSSLIILATNALIYILIAFNVSPVITMLTVAFGGIFFLIFKPIMDKVRKVSHHTANAQKEVANHINESMIGMKTIKAMAFEDRVVEKGITIFEKLRRAEMKLSVYANTSYVMAQPFSVVIIMILFAYSYKLTSFSFAAFAVIVYAINKIFSYVQSGQSNLQNIAGLYPYLKSVGSFEDEARANSEPYQGTRDYSFEKAIEFKNVSFAYTAKPVLSDFDLKIVKGEMIGIIGPSGSGKTTAVDLFLSLIKPQQGEIYVDGTPLQDLNTKKWKGHIGYVSQDIFIVNDTIRNNIKFYDPTISDEDMIEAAKKAHIYDFIMSQPHGFDSAAGERGMELSGGQRQRIALARVLARKADILVLDEATSALDNESEAAIQKAIEELHGKVTTLIIAHRPTTVANADRLIVIKDSKLVEAGAPQDLLKDEQSYFHKIFYAKH
jgi:ABC-type multidrug transport system fused ATPase/permease subunit